MTLAQELRTHRTTLGLTQVQYAERIGVSRQAIIDWEQGSLPSFAMVQKLVKDGIGITTILRELGAVA
jgi:DNA-binding XRE family transcriptional regulator